jgi:hypothetical protein
MIDIADRLPAVALAVLVLAMAASGCGLGEDGTIYVVMASGDMSQHGLMSSGLEYTTYTLEQLGLEELTDELIEVYDEYDARAQGVTERDELVMLLAQRQGDLAQVILMRRPMEQMLSQGIPAGVYRKSMSALDEACFPDEETYLAYMTRAR